MMKQTISKTRRPLILIALLATVVSTPAAIWQVNNNPGVKADFTTLQASHDAAQAGDTLYVHGSPTTYGNLNATKRISIYGPGYSLVENRNLQANVRPAQTGRIEFLAGSHGSLISGLKTGEILILANDVIVKRNQTESIRVGGSGSVSTSAGVANVLILENFSRARFGVYKSQRVIIRNNFFGDLEVQQSSDVFVEQNQIGSSSDGSDPSLFHEGTTVQNNLFRKNPDSQRITGSTFRNNLVNTDSRTGVYAKTTNRNSGLDADWQLSANSPARRAGINGEDLGPFGGSDPYVLSGMPSIPSIYSFVSPSTVTSHTGLRVQLKARANR